MEINLDYRWVEFYQKVFGYIRFFGYIYLYEEFNEFNNISLKDLWKQKTKEILDSIRKKYVQCFYTQETSMMQKAT